jgi:alpha-1,6-mannosyltransferase
MSSDARTLPLRKTPLDGAGPARRGGLPRADAAARAGAAQWAGGLALAAIVALSLLIVVLAADRPSILSPTTHANFYPGWMAGPLGGLWPGLTRSTNTLRYLFTGAVALMYIGYLVALRCAGQLAARWVIGAILAVHAIFLLAPPLALTDVFNYINYGRMEVVHHLNPYTTIPILEPHGDPSYALSNWHQLLSPYGPLFTLMTFAVVPLGVAASFWVLKAVLALTSLATIVLVWKCARLLGRDPVAAIVLVGLNPIVLAWGLGGDHNDFLMAFFIVLAFYLLLRARAAEGPGTRPPASARPRPPAPPAAGPGGWLLPLSPAEIGAGAAFVTAAAIKASAAVLIPVVLAGLVRSPRRLVQVVLGMAATGAAVAAASLAAFGLHVPDLSTQSRLVTNVSVPNLVGLALGQGGETESLHVVLSGVLAVAVVLCCVQAWRRRESITASGWASVALLVTLSWVLPWYVLWVLPLAALSSSRRLRVTALALGVYVIIAWAPASGLLWNAIGFHPEKTSLGRLHQRDVKELLN